MANPISQTLTTTILLLVAFSTMIPTINSICSDAMATSLSSSGFTIFAHALHSHNITTTTTTTTHLTYLAPPDTSLLNNPLDTNTLLAHVSKAGAFPYQSLLNLPHNSTLPTLHHNTTLIVGTEGKRVSFNDVLVVVPNLYIDGSCVVHGVDGPLVPIPSPVDEVPNPRKESKRYPVLSPRRRTTQFAQYVRFIRRAHRPSFVDESGGPHHLP